MSLRRILPFALLLSSVALGSACGDDSSWETPAQSDDDDDGSSGTPTPTGTATATPVPAYGGSVSLFRTRIDNSAGTTLTASATASFYEPVTLTGGTGVAPVLDACTVATPAPTPAGETWTSRDAGSGVSITGPNSIELARNTNGATIYYFPEVNPLPVGSITPGVFSMSWPGADGGLPSKYIASAIEVPSELTISSPSLPGTIGGGAFSVSWSGASSEPATVMLMTYVSQTQWASIYCTVNDDGSFTIPADKIAQLPSGTGQLMVSRVRQSPHLMPDGSAVYGSGGWQHVGIMTRP